MGCLRSNAKGLFLLLLLFLLNTIPGRSAGASEEPFREERWEKMSRDVDYTEELPPPVKKKMPRLKAPEKMTALQQNVLIATVVVVILGLLFLLIFRNATGQRVRKSTFTALAGDVPDEPQGAGMTEKSLLDALQRQDFRSAIRFFHHLLILRLSERGDLIYQKDKTNQQYLRELSNYDLLESVRILTRGTEAAWYGNRSLDEAQFKHLTEPFLSVVSIRIEEGKR